jgi:hypothetical protein
MLPDNFMSGLTEAWRTFWHDDGPEVEQEEAKEEASGGSGGVLLSRPTVLVPSGGGVGSIDVQAKSSNR